MKYALTGCGRIAVNHIKAALAGEGRTLAGIDCTPTPKNGPFRTFLAKADLAREQPTYYAEEA